MNIQDNILKQYLKNVYFVCGTACGGKSTLSRALAEKHGFLLYDADARFDEHIALSGLRATTANSSALFCLTLSA